MLTGLVLGAAVAAGLALVYPLPTAPPELDEATLAPPGALPEPAGAAAPAQPAGPPADRGLLRGAAPGPLIDLPEPPDPDAAGQGRPSLVPDG